MNIITQLFNGAIIGVANIIPGVSGGTMALILGFYERLIAAINNISVKTIWIFLKSLSLKKERLEEFKAEWKRIDAFFLVLITVGALFSVVALAKLMPILLEDYHDPTYGFFFGLILVSALSPYRLIKKKNLSVFIIALIAIVLIVLIANAASGERLLEKEKAKLEMKQKKAAGGEVSASASAFDIKLLLFMFILGAVAISAMILPGISGSFLLLLMGGYVDILNAVSSRNIPVLFVFAFGCLIGIALFSRLINFLLKRWHDLTMGFLVGLVVGSLWMIWPFKTSAVVGEKTVFLSNTIPSAFGGNEWLTIGLAVIGAAIVAVMLVVESRNQKRKTPA